MINENQMIKPDATAIGTGIIIGYNAIASGSFAMRTSHQTIEYIDFQNHTVICSICGEECEHKQSIPIDNETALVVSNDFIGKTGAVPVCRSCFAKHESGEFVGQDTRY